MLTNAQKTSEYITDVLAKKNPKYLPAINELMALEDQQQTTLAVRRFYLENFIAKLCEEYYGSQMKRCCPSLCL